MAGCGSAFLPHSTVTSAAFGRKTRIASKCFASCSIQCGPNKAKGAEFSPRTSRSISFSQVAEIADFAGVTGGFAAEAFRFSSFPITVGNPISDSGHHLTGAEAPRQTRRQVIPAARNRNVLDLVAEAR